MVPDCPVRLTYTQFYSSAEVLLYSCCRVSKLWKESVAENHPKLAATLADPAEYDNLFPGLKESETTEKYLTQERKRRLPARAFPTLIVSMCITDLRLCALSVRVRLPHTQTIVTDTDTTYNSSHK